MSTTITYKGAQIATVANNSVKTLKTSSTWVEDNISIQNVIPATKFDDIIERTISGNYQCDTATSIRQYAFYSASLLTSVYFPNATYVGLAAFYQCYSLTNLNLPNVTTLSTGGTQFRYCSALTTINMPKVTYIPTQAFTNCLNLTSISFPNISYIGLSAFQSCSKLESVYLYGSSVALLSSYVAFQGTPIYYSTYIGHFGSIYVPASLLNSYKAAAQWSRFSSRFVGV